VDEKVALVDAVKEGKGHSMIDNIAEIIDPSKIDYVISNHTEPDHSGEITKILHLSPNATVVATEKGRSGLEKYYQENWKFKVVKTGDSITLGKHELQFINTPMLHWPDSMFTYLPAQKLLFSMDAFGQHYASSGRFDTEVDMDVLMAEAKTYYANIIMHLGSIVSKTLKQAEGLEIEMICPSHGVIWTEHRSKIISAYQDWSQCLAKPKILVIYDSMWHSTELMAKAISDGASRDGIDVKLLRLDVNDLTTLATEILDAAAVAVGSPTLNNNMMPTVAAFLTYIKGLKPKGKLGVAFGSYGWSGGAIEQAAGFLQEAGFEMFGENIGCQYRPNEEIIEKCRQMGVRLADQVNNRTK
jgi:flavorubredoxin